MVDYRALIDKYYSDNPPLKHILEVHSRLVCEKALACLAAHPEHCLDRDFVEEGAWLHDIGIFYTNAPAIHCHGTEPYLCHGLLGAKLLRFENLPRHARVAERHTGAGLTKEQILARNLPLPPRDFLPETLEEQLICYADKFFSKTHLTTEKPLERVLAGLAPFGDSGVETFLRWHKSFAER
ncbi:MAG: phosphohydrolase [Bacteroidaceae bacterium]|nr:phosphohydrolase [Bacteroidaceae bacterium]